MNRSDRSLSLYHLADSDSLWGFVCYCEPFGCAHSPSLVSLGSRCAPQKPLQVAICMTPGANSSLSCGCQRTLFSILALCEADLPCCHFDAFGSVTSAPALQCCGNCCVMECSPPNVASRSRTAVAAENLAIMVSEGSRLLSQLLPNGRKRAPTGKFSGISGPKLECGRPLL